VPEARLSCHGATCLQSSLTGLVHPETDPALKRRAIFKGPCGTSN